MVTFDDIRQANDEVTDLRGSMGLVDLMLKLMEESKEACDEMRHLTGPSGISGDFRGKRRLAYELGDVVVCAEMIARQFDIDLGASTMAKLRINKRRAREIRRRRQEEAQRRDNAQTATDRSARA